MRQPLRVALASHLASPDAPTGAERVVAQLAAGLAERGHQVTVLVPGPWCLAEQVRDAGARLQVVPARPCWLTYWEERPWPVVAWKAVACAVAMGAAPGLRRVLTRSAPQVVVVNCLPHRAAAAAAGRTGVPWVWHLHEILPPGWRRRHWGRVLARSGARLVAVSQAVRGWVVEEQPGLQVEVVYNGVSLPSASPDPPAARRALGLPEGGVWAGFLGQLAPHKGVDLLLEAAARVPGQELRVLIAGRGSARQQRELRQRAAALLGERCTFFPPRPQVAPLLAACDLLCVPTLTPDPAPLAVLEGMAAGRVVIGSPGGGIPELIQDGETGVVLPSATATALAEALVRLAADGEQRRRLATAARARVAAEFSLSRQLDRMETILAQAVGAAPSPSPPGGSAVGDRGEGGVSGDRPNSGATSQRPTFTVFTPTYNRAHTLPRLYQALKAQTFRDFEWLVVDDGSTDHTPALMAGWQREGFLTIRYLRQLHGHKKVAFNRGVREARGELFLTLDSDDTCLPQALERFWFHWQSIPAAERERFSAVTALCVDEAGQVVGDPFPAQVIDSNSLEMRHRYRVRGEKWGFHRTQVLRAFPFPEDVRGYVPEDVVWMAIARRWRTRFVNEALRVYCRGTAGDAAGRITTSLDWRAMAPGHVVWMLSILAVEWPYLRANPRRFVWAAATLTRFRLHGGRVPAGGWKEVSWPARLLVLAMAPAGLALWLRDLLAQIKNTVARRLAGRSATMGEP